ncbi:MAG: ABC transporter ATP-binding protein [archaeon]|jgi:putative ABC transport system ATP-binding protein
MKSHKLIEIKNVTKTYKMGDTELNALTNINFDVYRGDFIIINGPSGSGKSTLMNIVGCLDLPTTGEVYLGGQNITKIRESELAKLRGKTIGFIFQQFNLMPTLTALENVILPLEFQNIDPTKARMEALDKLKIVNLEDRLHHLPKELSGGQQQRVAIARALCGDPEIILADEPTGNLDSKTGMFVMNFLKELHKKGKTIIVVTHDLNISKYGDKIIHIIDGRINKIEQKKEN